MMPAPDGDALLEHTPMGASDPIAPPPPALLALEGRAWLELAAIFPTLGALTRAPVGDGHPVLIFPGWLAGDRSTRTLRWFLRGRGYYAHRWKLGLNLGPSSRVVEALAKRLHGLAEQHGRSVSLIGWSLGGIYARELARAFPDQVRQVITLGTPFRDVMATCVARLPFQPRTWGDGAEIRKMLRQPLPVPSTSIYSRSDGIVAWRSCLDDAGARRENVEVRSSHCGMGHHPATLMIIADRLAQPEGEWRPFAGPSAFPWFIRMSIRGHAELRV